METKHTPTPWKAGHYITSPDKVIMDSIGMAIANMNMAERNTEANAAYIVHACNAHDELVAALESMIKLADWYAGFAPVSNEARTQSQIDRDKAREALEKLKG